VRAVNLLPRDARRARSDAGRAPLYVLAGGIAGVTVVAGLLFHSAAGGLGDRRAELETTQAALAGAAQHTSQPVASEGMLVQERADRVVALAAGLSNRLPMDRVLRELSYVLPADAWLTGLSATSEGATSSGAAAPSSSGGSSTPSSSQHGSGTSGVTIEGVTYTQEGVARVLSRLSVLPSLENVHLTASARVQPQTSATQPGADAAKAKPAKKQKAIVTFTITADFAGGQSS